jgi:hypothetical protein
MADELLCHLPKANYDRQEGLHVQVEQLGEVGQSRDGAGEVVVRQIPMRVRVCVCV